MLALMSPFKSIKDVVHGLGWLGKIGKLLVAERFNNLERMERVPCPVMFIHGLKDELIPKDHSEELHAKVQNISQIIIPEDMDHNNFDFYTDLALPIQEFMKKLKIAANKNPELLKRNFLKFNPKLYEIPAEYKFDQIKDKINEESFMRRMMNKYS